jgi:hypothetical protein
MKEDAEDSNDKGKRMLTVEEKYPLPSPLSSLLSSLRHSVSLWFKKIP